MPKPKPKKKEKDKPKRLVAIEKDIDSIEDILQRMALQIEGIRILMDDIAERSKRSYFGDR